MSRAKDPVGLIIGGEPRIDFLPPEIKEGKQARRTRRSLVVLVVVVALVSGGGYFFSANLAAQSQQKLDEAQERTLELLQEQGKYGEVGAVNKSVAEIKNARLLGSATEILWRDYLAGVISSLPAGTTIDSYNVVSPSVTDALPSPTIPLEKARVATITFTATFPSFVDAKTVLTNLRALPGFADAWASPVQSEDEEAGTYSANFTLNIDSEALAKRFFIVDADADSDSADTGETDPAATNTSTEEGS